MRFYPDMYSVDGNSYLLSTAAAAAAAASWSREEDKLFEKALVEIPDGVDDRWRKIANFLPNKSLEEVRAHYEALLYDVDRIESGYVELPSYSDEAAAALGWDERPGSRKTAQISFGSPSGSRSRHSEVERKKGTPWTEEEHRFFYLK